MTTECTSTWWPCLILMLVSPLSTSICSSPSSSSWFSRTSPRFLLPASMPFPWTWCISTWTSHFHQWGLWSTTRIITSLCPESTSDTWTSRSLVACLPLPSLSPSSPDSTSLDSSSSSCVDHWSEVVSLSQSSLQSTSLCLHSRSSSSALSAVVSTISNSHQILYLVIVFLNSHCSHLMFSSKLTKTFLTTFQYCSAKSSFVFVKRWSYHKFIWAPILIIHFLNKFNEYIA